MPLEFWFEFASTYSYPAAMAVETAATAAGVNLYWRPFLLGPIFKSQGWNDSPFNIYPAKGKYMWRDMQRICKRAGIAFSRPSRFPRNGLLAARLACWYQDEPWLPEFVRQVYIANFAEDRDIGDRAELESILVALGLPSALLDCIDTRESKEKLRSQTERAAIAGIFGAPSFVANEELFWGNERLHEALECSKQGDSENAISMDHK